MTRASLCRPTGLLECGSVVETDRIDAMRFSLVLGTFGRTVELEECLASLDAQTLRAFELIVVDQNPDERLAPILARYESRFPILHLRPEQRGLSRAKNLGLKHASGEVIGFPDDNCRYPPELLARVMRFFTGHPEIAGLCGRSVDDDGKDSNLRFDTEPGPVDRFNVWRRAMAYNIFVRAASARGVWFDERLGPGAGTKWGAADETDFVLKLLNRGAPIYYDPALLAIHPQPVTRFDEAASSRAYSYGCGMGHVLKKHRYPIPFRVKMLLPPIKNTLSSLARGKPSEARYRYSAFKGRVNGLLS